MSKIDPEMFNKKHAETAKKAGVTYQGTCEGLFYFDAPSRSTLVLPVKQVTVENIHQRLAEHKKRWEHEEKVTA